MSDTCTRCGASFDAQGNLGDSYFLCDECARLLTAEVRDILANVGRFHEAAGALIARIDDRVADIDTLDLARRVMQSMMARALYDQDREAELRTWVMALGALQATDPAAVMTEQINRLGGKRG